MRAARTLLVAKVLCAGGKRAATRHSLLCFSRRVANLRGCPRHLDRRSHVNAVFISACSCAVLCGRNPGSAANLHLKVNETPSELIPLTVFRCLR